MGNNFFKYELYKKLKNENNQYKWLESMYYELLELDTIKEISKYLTRGFKLSKNKSLYGELQRKDTLEDGKIVKSEYTVLRINIINMAKRRHNLRFLIETIAHEIAHFIHWNHEEEHTKLTKELTSDLINEFRIKKAKEIIKKHETLQIAKKI